MGAAVAACDPQAKHGHNIPLHTSTGGEFPSHWTTAQRDASRREMQGPLTCRGAAKEVVCGPEDSSLRGLAVPCGFPAAAQRLGRAGRGPELKDRGRGATRISTSADNRRQDRRRRNLSSWHNREAACFEPWTAPGASRRAWARGCPSPDEISPARSIRKVLRRPARHFVRILLVERVQRRGVAEERSERSTKERASSL